MEPESVQSLRERIEQQERELRQLRLRLTTLETRVGRLDAGEPVEPPPHDAFVPAPPPLPAVHEHTSSEEPAEAAPPAIQAPEPPLAAPCEQPVAPSADAPDSEPPPPLPPPAPESIPVTHPPASERPLPAPHIGEGQSPEQLPAAAAFMATPDFAEEAEPQRPAVSWEVRLATTWLPRIGGAFVIAGAAFFAMLITPKMGPLARVAMGYFVAALFTGAGILVRKRSTLAGRATIAIGLALAYFVSFAAHYIPPTRVMPAIPAVVLMVLFAGGIVGLAERWKSQIIAAMGLGLGVLAALVSAQASGAFALMALSVLALTAGVLLVRNEWRMLTAVALAGIYLAMPVLWVILGTEMQKGETLAHLGALLFYHAVFTAAFWKWGRAWVARERLAEEAPLEFATPRLATGMLPYSTAFSLINSLALVALSLLLFWLTKTFWSEVHWLLFGLAAAEGTRIALRPLRRGGLGMFHAMMAFGLVCAGVVSAFSGMAESAVLAMLTVIVAVAGSRAPQLSWLRPLTVVSAGIAVRSFSPSAGAPSFATLGDAMPGAFLLASALPWERIGVRTPKPLGHIALRVLEIISGQIRSFIGTVLLTVALMDSFRKGDSQLAVLCVLAVALAAGLVVLRAWAWYGAALLMTIGSLAVASMKADEPAWIAFHVLWIPLCFFFWSAAALRSSNRVASVFQGIAAGAMMVPLAVVCVHMFHPAAPFRGLIFLPAAAGFLGLAWMNARLGPMGALVRPMRVNRSDDEDAAPPYRHPRMVTATSFAAILMVAMGWIVSMAFDTTGWALPFYKDFGMLGVSLVPALIWSVLFGVAWHWGRSRFGTEAASVWLLVLLGLATPCIALLLYLEFSAMAFALCAVLLIVAAGGGLALRDRPLTDVALLGLSLLPFALMLIADHMRKRVGAPEELWLLGLAALLIASRRLAPLANTRFVDIDADDHRRHYRTVSSVWRLGVGAVLALCALALGPILPGIAVTASWGVAGALLLALGLLLRDKPMRIAAFAVFGLASVRIFAVDMTGFSIAARALAFFAIGALLVGAGVAYGFLRGRLEGPK